MRRRIIFPDTTPRISAACTAAVPGATVVSKRPAALPAGSTLVQYRNDSGAERDMLRTERWGVNIWAPKYRDALSAGLRVMAEARASLPDGNPITAYEGGTGPYEVVDNADPFDKHAHVYLTFELTVRGTDY